MLAFYAAPMNLAIFIEEEQIGGSAVAGLAISLITGTGFIGGMLFGHIKKVTATFLPALLLILMGTGYCTGLQAAKFESLTPHRGAPHDGWRGKAVCH